MTGVSYMIPFVVAGGILIAIALLWVVSMYTIPLVLLLTSLPGQSCHESNVPAMAAYIAYSIADRPYRSWLCRRYAGKRSGSGFLGGIVEGCSLVIL
jgi:fructose-specific phosphotransferase system IIC component